jgi:hypothetical protein
MGIELSHDEAEHLHVAYLLSINQIPFVDFIENHPLLFHHYIGWMERTFSLETVREVSTAARATIFAHFLICFLIFCLWTSRMIWARSKGFIWAGMIVAAWAMVDFYNPFFFWIWQLRPDFICYAYTLAGCYLVYIWLTGNFALRSSQSFALLIGAGIFMGIGNAILPKGSVLIGAMLLTFVVGELFKGAAVFDAGRCRKKLSGLVLFGTATVCSFIGAMLLDCHLSHISPQQWIAGVFLINARKHIVFSQMDDSPITAITSAFSLPFAAMLALLAWILWELSALRPWRKEREGTSYLLLFALSTIVINLLIGPYTNGVTWSYNFIPSLFAAAAIYLLLIQRTWGQVLALRGNRLLSPPLLGITAVAAFAAVQALNQSFLALTQYNKRIMDMADIQKGCPKDYLLDEALPASFTYFGRYPHNIPVKSRHWGFYFMLGENTGFWKDCHELGIGPDPAATWKKAFGNHPPDALAFRNPADVLQYIMMLYHCHNIDISWLIDEIKTHYYPMRYRGVFLYVLNRHVPDLEKKGWRLAPISHAAFSGFFSSPTPHELRECDPAG